MARPRRQARNQARAWTTAKDVLYRLLLVGLSLLLRQVWVWLTAVSGGLSERAVAEGLRYELLRDWVAARL